MASPRGSQNGRSSLEMILELYEALRDGRIEDVLAVTDPQVTCQPLVRPGLTFYHGHQGMTSLARDLHTVHGNYQVAIDRITEDGSKITVQARIMHKPGGPQPLRVTSEYTLRDGLIYSIESRPTDHE